MIANRPKGPVNPTVAIIIQGPLLSSGNSGNGQRVENFDCIPNIQRILYDFKHLGVGFILSTWINEPTNTLRETKKFKILKNSDPGLTQTLSHSLGNNDSRQAYSSLMGVKFAMKTYCPEYIIKMRTDQYVDLLAIYHHMVRTDRQYSDYRRIGQNGFIYFPNMLSYSPYSVGDFYIGGRASDVESFFTASVRYEKHSMLDYFPWVHSEIIHKHIYFNIRRHMKNAPCNFPPVIDNNLNSANDRWYARVKYPLQVLDAWDFTLKNSVSFFPKKIFKTLFWRGNQFDTGSHIVDCCFDEWINIRKCTQDWYADSFPRIFKKRIRLNQIHIIKYFAREKFLELELGYVPFSRAIYRSLRFFLLSVSGEYLFHDIFWIIREKLKAIPGAIKRTPLRAWRFLGWRFRVKNRI